MMHINIIFEDDCLAVVEKPAGLPVYPAKNANYKPQIINCKTLSEIVECKWHGSEPAHRLDNDTSGIMLIAKTKEAFEALRKQFDDGTVHKEYMALVLGETPAEGTIDTPVIHDPKSKKRMKVAEKLIKSGSKMIQGGQEARTEFKLVKKYLGGRFSLLRVTIKTGVRHQIRVHLASIGHPLVGDRLYQNGRQRERDDKDITRQFLHASHLGFKHPKNGKWMDLSSQLPPELDNALTKIG
ncbi:MAG: RNA pseudouridine synthase [Deltaproteobacteria bacterium CG11_big_fil_rev_8_21_14_0_20_49_13]|nr:MAG: RNA pseudouridine synthase [Deltaproteobacteria bacterium CG11_big_fil_rev_8_21_14_0_20_49_13]